MTAASKLKPKPSHHDEFKFIPTYTNTLPDLPYPGKFLRYNMSSLKTRFADYKQTQLEARERQTMCDMDVGVTIDLVDPKTYQGKSSQPEMDEKDLYLLEDESKESLRQSKRSAQHKATVPFMRRTEYISSEFNKLGTGADRQETRIGYNLLKRKAAEEIFYRDREAQIAAINKTFEDVKKPAKHHSKPGVTAVEECHIFPDFEMMRYPIVDVIFDADPTYPAVPEDLQDYCLKNSQIMVTDKEQNLVGLFCPPGETIERLKEMEGRDELEVSAAYQFNLNREYSWQIKSKDNSKLEDDYALYQRGDAFYYTPLNNHVKLMRKRVVAGETKKLVSLEVNYRRYTEEEEAEMDSRVKQILNPYENEEETKDEENEQMEVEETARDEAMETDQSATSSSPASSSTTDSD